MRAEKGEETGLYRAYYESPIGLIEAAGWEEGVRWVEFVEEESDSPSDPSGLLSHCIRQIDEYFRGGRKAFSLKLAPKGTEFQKAVWKELEKIPYGKTLSYAQIAAAVGKPTATRAVGQANGRNPISIIVPCHRVIGANGTLTGYGSGIWRKEWLLRHEGYLPGFRPGFYRGDAPE